MIMQTTTETFGKNIEVKTYFKPGKYIDDLQMQSLYRDILRINQLKESPLQHKLIAASTPLDEVKEIYSNMLVAVVLVKKEAVGFLLTPILAEAPEPIAHGGLTVIAKNHGSNLLGLMTLCNIKVLHNHYSKLYTSNISSTPSIIEVYTKFMRNVWPEPDANLIKAPSRYKKVFDTLIDKYVMEFFEDPENIIVDRKRFVIRTSSKKMGFNTNLRELSRSSKYKYFSFCFTWLDYEKEEDLVQIGMIDWWIGLKTKLIILFLRYWYFPNLDRRLKLSKNPNPIPMEQSMPKSNNVRNIKHVSQR